MAKALNTTDSASPPSLADGIDGSSGGGIHVISRDQSTPIIEVEGPLLSDTHVTFKVRASACLPRLKTRPGSEPVQVVAAFSPVFARLAIWLCR